MAKILIFASTDLRSDPRPHRQIKCLVGNHEVHSAGTQPSSYEDRFYKITRLPMHCRTAILPLLKLGFHETYYCLDFKVPSELLNEDFDLIIFHHIRLFPVVKRFSKSARLVLDAHEYYPDNFSDDLLWRLFFRPSINYLLSTYTKNIDTFITVNDSMANMYQTAFKARTEVIRSIPEYIDISPCNNSSKIRLIHHGVASPHRNLEVMIDMMEHLDPSLYELTLMLVYSESSYEYYAKLIQRASNASNIIFKTAVLFADIIPVINKYDIGLLFIPASNRNLQFMLPNKFFEYIQGRLVIASGIYPDVDKIMKQYSLGVQAPSYEPEVLAKTIKSIDHQLIMQYKSNVDKAAKDLNFENECKKLDALIRTVLTRSSNI